MSPIDIGGIVVAAIAALGALAAQRSASKAAQAGSRLDAEKDAYERARRMDIETIQRQDLEIDELRSQLKASNKEVGRLKSDNENLRKHVRNVEKRLAILEEISPALEKLLKERLEEAADDLNHEQ